MILIVHFARTYDRASFDCGVPSLNDWLTLQAGQQERRGNTRTFLAVESDSNEIVGYYASLAANVELPVLEGTSHRGYLQPAIRLARLAVSSHAQGKGIGSLLMRHFFVRALEVADRVGVELIVVDAVDEGARDFYDRQGFSSSEPASLFAAMSISTLRSIRKHV